MHRVSATAPRRRRRRKHRRSSTCTICQRDLLDTRENPRVPPIVSSSMTSSRPSQTANTTFSPAPVSTEALSAGLSPSVRVGIGIGVTIDGLLILILAYTVFRLVGRTRQLTARLDGRQTAEPGIAALEYEFMREPGVAVTESRR